MPATKDYLASKVKALREGSFITRDRLRYYPLAFLAVYAIAAIWLVGTSHRGIDIFGRPLGVDFSQVYSAGAIVREDGSGDPYDPDVQEAMLKRLFGPSTPQYFWIFPPLFLIPAMLLAGLPYLSALVLWQTTTLVAYLGAMRQAFRCRFAVPLALAYPAVCVNLAHGQTGFLTATLFTAGLSLMASKPFLAGMALGGLAFKPQLCVLLPIFILAGRHWRVALGASVLICVWTLASLALFGFESWLAFFETLSTTRHVIMDQQGFGFERMQTVFAAVRLLVGPVSVAYALQIVSTLAVIIVVFWLGRKNIDHRLQSAGLLASVLLATPYAFDYDMMVIAPAIAFFASYGLERGFRAYEKSVMTLAWFVPFVARGLAHVTPLPIGVFSTVILLVLIVQRARLERQSGEALLQPYDSGLLAGPVPVDSQLCSKLLN